MGMLKLYYLSKESPSLMNPAILIHLWSIYQTSAFTLDASTPSLEAEATRISISNSFRMGDLDGQYKLT